MCECVCVSARARARVRVCVCEWKRDGTRKGQEGPGRAAQSVLVYFSVCLQRSESPNLLRLTNHNTLWAATTTLLE